MNTVISKENDVKELDIERIKKYSLFKYLFADDRLHYCMGMVEKKPNTLDDEEFKKYLNLSSDDCIEFKITFYTKNNTISAIDLLREMYREFYGNTSL